RLPASAPAGRRRERDPVRLERLAGLLAQRAGRLRPRAPLRPVPADDPADARPRALVPARPVAAQPMAVPPVRQALRDPPGVGLELGGGLERQPGGGRPVLAAAPAPARVHRPVAREARGPAARRRTL